MGAITGHVCPSFSIGRQHLKNILLRQMSGYIDSVTTCGKLCNRGFAGRAQRHHTTPRLTVKTRHAPPPPLLFLILRELGIKIIIYSRKETL
jgi:hypothetical protein